jgi:hypothetical protein
MTRRWTSLLVLAALLPPRSGRAASPDDTHKRAAESFQQAEAAFRRREFAAAAASFEQAAEFETHPAALVNAAEAWELAGDLPHAAAACDGVLALPDVAAEFRADAERRLARLRPRIATLELNGAPPWSVRVDAIVQPVLLPTKRRLAPGSHVLAFVDAVSGEVRKLNVELAPGEVRTVEVPPQIVVGPLSSPAPVAPATTGPPAASWMAFGTALVAGGFAGAFGVRTLAAQGDFEESPSHETRDAFYRERTVTNVACAVAIAAALVGGVIWLTADRRRGDR